MIPLEALGTRMCIIGNSAAGKSTLAQHLGQHLNFAICHLDQLAHVPHTNWQPRDRELMRLDHQTFLIQHESWVIEGNYSYLMPERFAQATAIIWLDFSRWGSVYRFIKRSLQNNHNRAGNLEGASQQFNFTMLKHILITVPKNKIKYQELIEQSGVPCVRIRSFHQLKKIYKEWNL
ncbi:P-loop NTPase family protein [Myroides fluvii]|uniref:adenylate kinase n=1 Tax=Myroides fluvii TaxID=2572594 RepID=UPI00131E64EB|nr:adenylate kinase [Myroides fluvii]